MYIDAMQYAFVLYDVRCLSSGSGSFFVRQEIDGREVLPQERDFVRRLDEQKRKLNVIRLSENGCNTLQRALHEATAQAQRKRHLNRAPTDGRPRVPGTMPEKVLLEEFRDWSGSSTILR